MFFLIVFIYIGVSLLVIYFAILYKINLFRVFLLSFLPLLFASIYFLAPALLRAEFENLFGSLLFMLFFGYAIFFPFLIIPAVTVLVLFDTLSLIKRLFYTFWIGSFSMGLFYLLFGTLKEQEQYRWFIFLAGLFGSMAVVIDYFLYNTPKKEDSK